jgi:hypothetical protein
MNSRARKYTQFGTEGRPSLVLRVMLSIALVLSFLEYFLTLSPAIQLVPVAFVVGGAVVSLAKAKNEQTRRMFATLIAPAFVMLLLPAVSVVRGLLTGRVSEVEYGSLVIVTLISVRIILAVLPLPEVFRSYVTAAVISLVILVGTTFGAVVESALGQVRYAPYEFHPNLIAFLAVGFIPALWWRYRDLGTRRPLMLLFVGVCVVIIVVASSRGSAIALAAGVCYMGIMSAVWAVKHGRIRLTPGKFVVIGCVVAGAMSLLVVNSQIPQKLGTAFSDAFALDNEYRGLDTGLTGRVDVWARTLYLMNSNDLWLFGNGLRTSGEDADLPIDNGYLTLVYEAGILVAIAVTLRFVWLTFAVSRWYLRETDPRARRFYAAVLFTLIVFLTNNIVARFLFGIGNPFSILSLVLLVSVPSDFVKYRVSTDIPRPAVKRTQGLPARIA